MDEERRDRWTVIGIHGGNTPCPAHYLRHQTSLPATHVAARVELSTRRKAHLRSHPGIETGDESQQVPYTMTARGRHANHVRVVTSIGTDGELTVSDAPRLDANALASPGARSVTLPRRTRHPWTPTI